MFRWRARAHDRPQWVPKGSGTSQNSLSEADDEGSPTGNTESRAVKAPGREHGPRAPGLLEQTALEMRKAASRRFRHQTEVAVDPQNQGGGSSDGAMETNMGDFSR